MYENLMSLIGSALAAEKLDITLRLEDDVDESLDPSIYFFDNKIDKELSTSIQIGTADITEGRFYVTEDNYSSSGEIESVSFLREYREGQENELALFVAAHIKATIDKD